MTTDNFINQMQENIQNNNNKSCKIYFQIGKEKVYFTGDFDSGNLEKV